MGARKRILTFFQILGSIAQQDDPALVAVGRLVQDIDLELGQLGDGLLEHLTETLDGHLQILLVVLEDLSKVVAGEVEGKGVRPLQGLPALLESLGSRVQELDLDPGHPRLGLQAGHLLLRFQVQVFIQLGGLFVVGISVVVMQVPFKGGS